MATPTNTQLRRALGPRDVNAFTPRLTPAKQLNGDVGREGGRKDYGGTHRKHSLDFSDDGQTPKAVRYTGGSDKRMGIEHWLEDGVVDGSPPCPPVDDTKLLGQLHISGAPHITSDSQETLLNLQEGDFGGGGKLGISIFTHDGKLQPLQPFGNPGPPAAASFSSSAATALRLRLRVALFKVQTNQIAIPISHLQLPEKSPQPLSVFPPSLVRVSATTDANDEYYGFYDGDGTTTAPPSSPPPVTATAARFNSRGIPFLAPMRSSSPSPEHGKPLDFGSSSVVHGKSSPANR